MKKSSALFLAVLVLSSLVPSGCALFLLGAGAAGGYAISKDEIEGMTDTSYDKVWTAAREVARSEGAITLEDKTHGRIDALVGGSTVQMTIEQVTPKTVRTRIKARKTKGLFPDIELAQKIYSQMSRKIK